MAIECSGEGARRLSKDSGGLPGPRRSLSIRRVPVEASSSGLIRLFENAIWLLRPETDSRLCSGPLQDAMNYCILHLAASERWLISALTLV